MFYFTGCIYGGNAFIFERGLIMKKLVAAIISIVLLLSLATPCFTLITVVEVIKIVKRLLILFIDGWSMAEDVKLAAEGCLGSKSQGAKVKTYKKLTSEQTVRSPYWNYFTNYGYIIFSWTRGWPAR